MLNQVNLQNVPPYKYIDLSVLNPIGQQKLLEFYNDLLKQFYQSKPELENDFYTSLLWLSEYNEKHLVTVGKDINLSDLANEVNDVIL